MHEKTYERRVAEQIAQYAATVNMHDLPEIFHLWSNSFIAPGIEQVFGVRSINDIYVNAFIEAIANGGGRRILSIGCGDGSIEICIANALLARGFSDFQVVGSDLSPILLARFQERIQSENLTEYCIAKEVDLNSMSDLGRFSMIMANHSLHHIEALEQLFENSWALLEERGIFATCDMIGRNGHMRWMESEIIIQSIWSLLEPKQRFHAQLKRYEERYRNHDCSVEGFEGIRAQDILPLMLERFHPYRFFGAGGFVDLLVDRGYGHSFDPHSERDRSMILFLGQLNDMLLDAKVITPTMMFAWFTKDDRGEVYYRNRRAVESVRKPDVDPCWVRHYADFVG